jgi:hypothetical protein
VPGKSGINLENYWIFLPNTKMDGMEAQPYPNRFPQHPIPFPYHLLYFPNNTKMIRKYGKWDRKIQKFSWPFSSLISPPYTASDEINLKLTWVGPPPTCTNAANTIGASHRKLPPPSSHHKSQHHRAHACTTSLTTLMVAAQKHTQLPTTPLSHSDMHTRGLVTKFETTHRALVFK